MYVWLVGWSISVSMCMSVYTCACVQRPEESTRCLGLSLSSIFTWDRSPREPGDRLASRKTWHLFCLHIQQCRGYKQACSHIQIFMQVLGSELKSLRLWNKFSYLMSYLSSPIKIYKTHLCIVVMLFFSFLILPQWENAVLTSICFITNRKRATHSFEREVSLPSMGQFKEGSLCSCLVHFKLGQAKMSASHWILN